MGVLACDRNNCPEIMCDRLILHRSKYICNGCYDELLKVKETWPKEMTAIEMEEAIVAFMDTRPGTHERLRGHDLDDLFESLTGGHNNDG